MIDLLADLPDEKLSRKDEDRLLKKNPQQALLNNMRESFLYGKKCCRDVISDPEIFSLCWEALNKAVRNYKPGGLKFFSYAKIYVRSEMFKVCKSHGNHDESLDELNDLIIDQDDGVIPETATVPANFELIDLREKWDLVKPVIDEILSEQERMIVSLRYRTGWNFQKIGQLLRISRSAVQQTHANAIIKIKAALIVANKL